MLEKWHHWLILWIAHLHFHWGEAFYYWIIVEANLVIGPSGLKLMADGDLHDRWRDVAANTGANIHRSASILQYSHTLSSCSPLSSSWLHFWERWPSVVALYRAPPEEDWFKSVNQNQRRNSILPKYLPALLPNWANVFANPWYDCKVLWEDWGEDSDDTTRRNLKQIT